LMQGEKKMLSAKARWLCIYAAVATVGLFMSLLHFTSALVLKGLLL